MDICAARQRLGLFGYSLLLLLLALVTAPYARAESFSILSQNMNRLFDDIDDGNREKILSPAKFRQRVADTAQRFAEIYRLPQVIALQEVENLNVLHQISEEINRHHDVAYQAILIPGQDISSINLGFLVRPEVTVQRRQQLFGELKHSAHAGPLFSRPPLLLDTCLRSRCVTIINLHLRSMRGIDDPIRGARVIDKRLQQAETVAGWINQFQRRNPERGFMLVGDFNALTPADAHIDVAGTLRGKPDNTGTRRQARDLVVADLIDLTRRIAPAQRHSFIFRQRKQQLDYLFVNKPLAKQLQEIYFGTIDYRFSDHAGLHARFRWP